MLVAIPHIWHCNASIPKSIHLLHNILFVIFFFAVVVVMPCGAALSSLWPSPPSSLLAAISLPVVP